MKIDKWIKGTALAIGLLAAAIAPAQDCLDYQQYMGWIGSTSTPLKHPDGLGIAAGHLCVATRYDGLKVYEISNPSQPQLISTTTFPSYAADVECRDHLAYVALGFGPVQVVDVTDPLRPMISGALSAYGYRLQIDGDKLFVYDNSGITLFDISVPEVPLACGRIAITYPRMIAINGNYAYVTAYGTGLVVYDISDLRAPVERRRLFLSEVGAVVFHGQSLYVEAWNVLNTYSLTEPANPRLLRSLAGEHGGFADAAVLEDRLVINSRGRIKFFDIRDPAWPVPLGSLATDGTIDDVEINGGQLYAASGRGLQCFDIAPRFVAPEHGGAGMPGSTKVVCAAGNHAYAVDGPGRLQCIDIAVPSAPRIVATCELPNGPLYNPSCVEINGDHAYIAYYGGLEVVDVGDPLRPVPVKSLPLGGAMDVAVRDTIAVVAVGGPGSLKFLDIRDAASPVLRGTLGMPLVSSVAFCGGFVYAAVHTEGLRVIDIANLGAPQVVGSLALDDHFGKLLVAGDRAYLGSNDGLRIFDTSDPARPRLIETLPTPALALRLRESEGHLYAACGYAGLQIFDFGDHDQLLPAGTVPVTDFAYDLSVAGRFAYLAAGDAGLRVASAPCPPPPLAVTIDIKPGSAANPVQCRSLGQGVIPVAILTTATFDAATVDHTTVRFGPAGAAEAHANRRGPIRHLEDVDGDGDRDLVFHFRQNETGIRCGDTEATLTGLTYDGRMLVGTDVITTQGSGGGAPTRGSGVAVAPNPFNPQTMVSFTNTRPGHVRAAVHDVKGRLVATLADQAFEAGEHAVTWRGCDDAGRPSPSGVYFFRVETDEGTQSVRAMLLK